MTMCYYEPEYLFGRSGRTWWIAPALALLALAVLVAALMFCGGCRSDAPSEPQKSTPTLAAETVAAVRRADAKLAAAQPDIPATRPATLVREARVDLAEAVKTGQATATAAVADVATIRKQGEEIGRLKAADPLRSFLRWAGGIAFVAGVCVGIAWALVRAALLAEIAGLLLAAGAAFSAIARYLHQIELVAGLAMLALLLVAAWLAWKRFDLWHVLTRTVKGIDAGRKAGEVKFQPKTPVTDATQGNRVKAVIDRIQKKGRT